MVDDGELLAGLLRSLGLAIRRQIVDGRDLTRDHHVVGRQAGDTIFAIDRRVEPLIEAAMAAFPKSLLPLLVTCEGLGEDGRRRFGPATGPLRYQVLIDPIDGTRGLAYDKRPAWFLAAAAPDRGEATRLSEAIASVMVELPTSKQCLADDFSWAQGSVEARRLTGEGDESALGVGPSAETTLRHGFGQVSSFFPGTKRLAADLMEYIAFESLGSVSVAEALIFEDQYISSGGQLVELMTGKDRFCCDLRPIFYEILRREGSEISSGLSCHPYDLGGLPIATAAGVQITDGFGRQLDVPFDVETPVHWCGYANDGLRTRLEPIIQAWLRKKLGETQLSASGAKAPADSSD